MKKVLVTLYAVGIFILILCISFLVGINITSAKSRATGLTAGASTFFVETLTQTVVEEESTEVVMMSYDDVIDITCEKLVTPSQMKKLGIVKYGYWTYTYYSQKVLPGGGLKIPGRHLNDLGCVCDEDGYIVIASDDLVKGVVVDTPLGIKGKVYDCGSGYGNLDIYVGW